MAFFVVHQCPFVGYLGSIVVPNHKGMLMPSEHHLFPSMPTPHQRRAQAVVREFCAEVGVPYHETTLVGSWSEMLAALRTAAAPLR